VTRPNVLPPQLAVPLLDVEGLQNIGREAVWRVCLSQNEGAVANILNIYEYQKALWRGLDFLDPKLNLFSRDAAQNEKRDAGEDEKQFAGCFKCSPRF